MSRSSFCGRIDEIPGISVDNFEDVSKPRAYFLSHCHSDHTQGLFRTSLLDKLKRTNAFIYMSVPSAAIVKDEAPDCTIMRYIKPLKLGTPFLITLPADFQNNLEELCVNVTLITAGHCFGSVMFLFRTTAKTVLFTGDFRINSNDLPKYGYLHKHGDPIKIDAMYVDTTFSEKQYAYFPKRSESVEDVVAEIKKWLDDDEKNHVALHTSAKYGYEFVFNEIYHKLNMKAYVSKKRWEFYRSLTHLVPGVTNDYTTTRIHVCLNRNENFTHKLEKCIPVLDTSWRFLFVHFSALKWDNVDTDMNFVNRISDGRLDVCFSTHCSRSELLYFVRYLNPKRVVGFPKEFVDSPSKKVDQFAVTPKKRIITSPVSDRKAKVERKMNKTLLRKIFD